MIAESLRKLAGQALCAGFAGREPPRELVAAAARDELAGFILFRRNLGGPDDVAALTAALAGARAPGAPPLFIAVDQEGGRVQRLGPPVLQLPPMRALGLRDDAGLTERAGAVLGRQLAALGFNIDFAPVLDVDSRPDSPVIGDRSFGSDPERVARHGIAFARGLRSAGVAACGKHFPGHGDAALDSHFDLPRVAHARQRLDQVELWPFRRAAGELDSIMTAHIVFDALDADRPATLSRAALQELLRGAFGFGGVIFSDDLEMKAIADRYDVAEAACEAVVAGCDVLLVCSDEALCLRVHEALARRAAGDGALRAALEAAAGRSRALRARLAAHPGRTSDLAAQLRALGDSALEDQLARRDG